MKQRTLGRSGLLVSQVGLGCNNFGGRLDFERSRAVVHGALDRGITLFDTADTYGGAGASEEFLGRLLGERRKDIVLATKFGMAMDEAGRLKGGSRRYIMSAVEASLKRLKTDWIDLYQLHRVDPLTPIEETLGALSDLVRQGKVRYIGCSNMPAWQVATAQCVARERGFERFVSAQDEYSLLVRGHVERELLPALGAFGMGLLPFYPLAAGLLTGKYRRNTAMPADGRLARMQNLQDRYMTEANWEKMQRLEDLCAARGLSLLEVAFAWLLSHPEVSSVIAGATRPEQLDANIAAGNIVLSAEDRAEIDRLTAWA